ncbi:hypothetical protein ACWCOV_26790 [Kribbella sp. NPDC002412]
MTDAVQPGTEWVPAIGKLEELQSEHAAVIQGLFELAAFVADHPELPAPKVRAVWFPPYGVGDDAAQYAASRGLVDSVARACGSQPKTSAGGTHYDVSTQMGPVEVTSFAITPEHMAQHRAHMSYSDNVKPATASVEAAGGAR